MNTPKKKRKMVPMYSAADFFSGKKDAKPVGWMSDPDEPGPVVLDHESWEKLMGTTSKSLLKLQAEKYKSVPTAREQAEAILARMNDMLRDRSFFEAHVEKKFNQLNERLHALGWLGLIKKFTRKGGKYYAQLKLVDPDSEEARRVM